jgi:hypothetical protein
MEEVSIELGEKKQGFQAIIEQGYHMALLIMVLMTTIASVLFFLIFMFAMIQGVTVDTLQIFMLCVIPLLVLAMFLLFMTIKVSGDWFMLGWKMFRRSGQLFFLVGLDKKIRIRLEPKKEYNEFWKGVKDSRFQAITSGYQEASTGTTAYIIRENEATDYDIWNEKPNDIKILAKNLNQESDSIWNAALDWVKKNKDFLQLLVIITLIITLLGAAVNGFFGYTAGDKLDKLTATVSSLPNKEAVAKAIQEAINASSIVEHSVS